jgi:hypothetical protein
MNTRFLSCTVCAFTLTTAGCSDNKAGEATPNGATASGGAQQLRGTLQTVSATELVVMTANGAVHVAMPTATQAAAVAPSDRSHIANGSFLGIGSTTEPDGSQTAVEITVFPEALRGTGEGSYAWNHGDGSATGSKMTNGTAAALKMTNGAVIGSRMTNGAVSSQTGGTSITLTYKNGSSNGTQTIAIPPSVPIVTLEPAQASDLRPGAHVIVFVTRDSTGGLSATRVLFGKDGLVPPQ